MPFQSRWFIPARTGNTLNATHGARLDPGSSPHARGTRTACPQNPFRGPVHPRTHGEHGEVVPGPVPVQRFIPARTGNTFLASRASTTSHGSSPHARGTLSEETLAMCLERFIPARTGNTRRPRRFAAQRSVHPRTHGEHSAQDLLPDGNARFIPARTGNTAVPSGAFARPPVHPRTHGEHSRRSEASQS